MAEQEDAYLGLAKEAAETTARYQAANVKMRARADNWGKSLTALGAAVVGYIGITKATDVFPVPPGWWWLPILTFALLTVMAVSAIGVGWRLSRVARPIAMKLDPNKILDVSDKEREEVARIYQEQAETNGAASLNEYDERAQKIFKSWEDHTAGDPLPEQPYSRGAQIRAEVNSAMQRGTTLVVQRRYAEATTSKLVASCIAVFLAAGVAVGLAIDKLDAVRTSQSTQITERLATIKQCAEAQAGKVANSTITLPLPQECFG